MELFEYRHQIDTIDDALIQLLCQRMALSAKIAQCKQEQGLAIHAPQREAEILSRVNQLAGPVLSPYLQALYKELLRLSRCYQENLQESDREPSL